MFHDKCLLLPFSENEAVNVSVSELSFYCLLLLLYYYFCIVPFKKVLFISAERDNNKRWLKKLKVDENLKSKIGPTPTTARQPQKRGM